MSTFASNFILTSTYRKWLRKEFESFANCSTLNVSTICVNNIMGCQQNESNFVWLSPEYSNLEISCRHFRHICHYLYWTASGLVFNLIMPPKWFQYVGMKICWNTSLDSVKVQGAKIWKVGQTKNSDQWPVVWETVPLPNSLYYSPYKCCVENMLPNMGKEYGVGLYHRVSRRIL